MTTQRPQAQQSASQALPVEALTDGSWSSRWGDWVVHLRGAAGQWVATVWRWPFRGTCERAQHGALDGFATPVDAVEWACDLLRAGGAQVFIIDKPSLRLEALLRFSPAPEAVT